MKTLNNRQAEHLRIAGSISWSSFFRTVFVAIAIVQSHAIEAQELHSSDPVELISSTQRLAVQQIDELIESRQFKDAAAQLQILKDLPAALIESSLIQSAATQHVQPYQPLGWWCQRRLKHVLASDQQLRGEYEKQWGTLAISALRTAQRSKANSSEAELAIARFGATGQATSMALLLTDIHLEQGDSLAAAQVLDSQFPQFSRIALREIDPNGADTTVTWYRAWQTLWQDARLAEVLLQRWTSMIAGQPELVGEVLSRQLSAAALSPQLLDCDAIIQWSKVAATKLPDPSAQAFLAHLSDVESWTDSDFAGSNRNATGSSPTKHLFSMEQRPHWQSLLDRWSSGSDLTPATRPAVGQMLSAQPYFPTIYDGKVFLHELTRIKAFQLDDGKQWPSQTAIFDSQTNPSAFLPLGYPLQGSPRAGLSILEGCLYARMGSPVTAWNNRSSSNDGSSISYLVGLDLDKQGSQIRGFPLRLRPPQFENAEFEGTPIVVGQTLVVAVTERDNVGIRRGLAAFDRFSGALLWRTKTLGSGNIVGSERANLISASQPTVAGGLIYYSTDLGSIACVDLSSGQTIWLSSYQRMHRLQSDYPKPNRYRYRDGNACEIHRGLVYCLPQDCPELLALDAFTGDLVWSTDDEDVSDCTYQLAVQGDSLLVGGDRLVWLHRITGAVLSQFPTRTTPGLINALPQPRGLGRACIVVDRVYWPTAQQVYVFPADLSFQAMGPKAHFDTPPLLQQMQATFCGTEGGNILADGRWLLMATPGRLACFRAN